jgi:TRAP-type mannitol/chloroaromatic compound transport system substrate-binding protein
VRRRLGATPVMTPPGEIAPALASGAVDGADWVGPWNDIAFGLYKYAKYYYMPGFHEPGPSLEVIMNADAYRALSADLRAIMAAAAHATAIETLADFTFHNIEAGAQLESKYGVKVRSFSDDVVQQLRSVSNEVLAQLSAADPLTLRVHRSYMEFLQKASAYAPHAEQGFLNMRTSLSRS